MAMSTCTKCGGHVFEMQEVTPMRSQFKYEFIQCASCGAVVGVMDWWNIGGMIEKQNQALKKIAQVLKIHVDLD